MGPRLLSYKSSWQKRFSAPELSKWYRKIAALRSLEADELYPNFPL